MRKPTAKRGTAIIMQLSHQVPESDPFEPRLGRSVSIEQAAQLLGVSRRTVYNRIRDGRLQTIRTMGGSQRVLLTSLDEMRRLALGRGDGFIAPPINLNRQAS